MDEDEAYRLLFDEEWTYPQMVDLYREKYGIETTISMWSRFVKRVGGRRSAERFPLATPWVMHAKEPRNSHYRTGLRALAAIEQGAGLRLGYAGCLAQTWLLITTGTRTRWCSFLAARAWISGGSVTRSWVMTVSLWLIFPT